MKMPLIPSALVAALGFVVFPLLHSTARAGSAVATDEHGGFGYAFGNDSQEELQREAVRRCRAKSDHPDDVHVIVTTRHRGSGVVVRYVVDGRRHIYAYVGAASDQQADRYATGYVEGYGGSKIEVVARWRDEE